MTGHEAIVTWIKYGLALRDTLEAPTHKIVDSVRDHARRYYGKSMSAGTVERRWREFKNDDSLRREANVGEIREEKQGAESVWIIQRIDC